MTEALFCTAHQHGLQHLHECIDRHDHPEDEHRCHCGHTWVTERTPTATLEVREAPEPNVLVIRPGDVLLVPPYKVGPALNDLMGGDRFVVVCAELRAPWILRKAEPDVPPTT